jgi:HemX protein
MERWLLVLTIGFLLASFAYTVFALGRGRFRPGRFNFAAIAGAFVILCVFLYERGQTVRSCPLTTIPDVLAFLGWAILLIYLVIGPAYRLSLLGAFTAPLVLILLAASLAAPHPPDVAATVPPDAWVELHAALSVVAYGAFGLAAVAGGMYLLQERQLKKHRVSTLFYNLPPIEDLARANGRLIGLGFLLLTIAFAAGLFSQRPVDGLKIWASLIIWALYGTLFLRRNRHNLTARAQSLWSLWFFLFILLSLPWVHYLSTTLVP